MKLTKLSLAALVAVGAFGSFASASPLEEAIKGVDVSGFMRLRYYGESQAGQGSGTVTKDEAIRVSGLFVVKAPVTDDLKFVTAIATNGYNDPDVGASGATTPAFNKFFFQYANSDIGLTVNAGKFEVPTPWTEAGFGGTRGNGVLALFSPKALNGWTFAGAAYLQTDSSLLTNQNNLYAMAAIGKVGPVGLQVWLANMEKTIDATLFAEASFAMSGFNARFQANYLMLHEDVDKDADDSIFLGLEGGYAGKAGNVGFNAKAGATWTNDPETKDAAGNTVKFANTYFALDEDNDGFIKFGKQMYKKTINSADTIVGFMDGGVSVDKFSAGLGAGMAKFGRLTDDDVGYEVYTSVGYKWAKNMNLELYWSSLFGDAFKKAYQNDNNEVRFEARYNF
jgi:hypothetical protein